MHSPFLWEKRLPTLFDFLFLLDNIDNGRFFLAFANSSFRVFTIVLIGLYGFSYKWSGCSRSCPWGLATKHGPSASYPLWIFQILSWCWNERARLGWRDDIILRFGGLERFCLFPGCRKGKGHVLKVFQRCDSSCSGLMPFCIQIELSYLWVLFTRRCWQRFPGNTARWSGLILWWVCSAWPTSWRSTWRYGLTFIHREFCSKRRPLFVSTTKGWLLQLRARGKGIFLFTASIGRGIVIVPTHVAVNLIVNKIRWLDRWSRILTW